MSNFSHSNYFTDAEWSYLKTLANKRPEKRKCGNIARFFAEEYALGHVIGSNVEYLADHHDAAENMLRTYSIYLDRRAAPQQL